MPFDIYGQRLSPGHCEVHPHVAEPYPCAVCLADARWEDDHYRELETKAHEAMEREYEREMTGRLYEHMEDVVLRGRDS